MTCDTPVGSGPLSVVTDQASKSSRRCPALLVSAPASGQGKTTVVAALARHHSRLGRRVRVLKTGPDFLDPMVHQRACGSPVYPLDLWMVGDALCQQVLHEAAGDADLILVEGVMGLYDGTPSSADLALRFGLPVAAVIDAGAMAQTFGALALGLARYTPGLTFAGVFANRVASDRHRDMLRDSLPAELPWLGNLPKQAGLALPSRHLGLHQADAIADLDERLDRAADLIATTPLAALPAPITFQAPPLEPLPRLLQGLTIAVARDAAFSFVYQANLEVLEAMGAELCFFSPLNDSALPAADSLYLPGGYPELHLDRLADNTAMLTAISTHHRAGKAIVAESGGMLYLLESLTTADGHCRQLAGLIPASASMGNRLGGLGLQGVHFPQGLLRGHTFHYSTFDAAPNFTLSATRHPGGQPGEGVVCDGALTASYIHWYLSSNPQVAAHLFLGKAFLEQMP
ncbi:MAG: cobyrinate a,c-diamide synthase [Porticoccaceae bacterium]|nr:cobyrinate a,c-diamide synthase [Porticoccaceae bacterium]